MDFEKISIFLGKSQYSRTPAEIRRYYRTFLSPNLDKNKLIELELSNVFELYKSKLMKMATDLFPMLLPECFPTVDALYQQLIAKILPKLEPILREKINKGTEYWRSLH